MKYFIIILLVVLVLPLPVLAAEAYMFLSSGAGTYLAGHDLETRVVINSGGIPGINAAEGIIHFDPSFLEVKEVSTTTSRFELWTKKPAFSNERGEIIFGGGLPGKFDDSACVVFNLVFRPKKSGRTVLTFGTSTVLSADGKAKNVLQDAFEAVYYFTNQHEVNRAHQLAERLSGRILLQVERNGEAWYVYPNDLRRYYLGRPLDAFVIMRKLGLGATHKFITEHTIYPRHVWGKILLDVEEHGEAYYINPEDKKAYYLGRPKDAFQIMRDFGLGITNADLYHIPDWAI